MTKTAQLQADRIWTGTINERPEVKGGFDRSRTVRFYDTTLRDGEQAVGVVFSSEDKFAIACALDDLGIGRIESGFPRVSVEDTKAVERILAASLKAEIWGFSRAVKADIDAHIELGTTAILIEIATSDAKIAAYGFTRETVITRLSDAIRHARAHGMRVIFFPVDATRADLSYLEQVYHAAVRAGAEEVAVVDTIGACAPEAVEFLIRKVAGWLGPDVPIHWHGHNDFGLATAAAIAAVRGGATWIQGTINGMGERAGNADICEVALALSCLYDVPVEMDLSKARRVSEIVRKAGGYQVDKWKPVVGEALFVRESGAVAAQFHMPDAIEPYSSEIVAAERGIVLGKKSGLANIEIKLKEVGITLDKEKVATLLAAVKDVATRERRLIGDEEFAAMARALP
ncbi:MAG: homoaconitate hydratase [Alphaproteobacteria bacterium]|nr:homoaconitate hydratase [Alphaproteobacteria bacterium]